MKVYLEKLIQKLDLTQEECRDALLQMDVNPETGAFLALMRAKGETVDELVGFAKALRAEAKPLEIPYPTLDIVGTGGDGAGTVNISTGSALLAARCGVPVVKHGNRAISSSSGSADVLEALGFSFENPKKSLEKTSFAFCLAGDYHPLMLKLRPLRRRLKIPTLFNLLGPLLNPAGTDHLMIGVFGEDFVSLIAETLFKLGTKRSLVFHGNGIDELSCLGPTEALLVTENGIEPFRIDPESLGLSLCTREDLQGGTPEENGFLLAQALRGAIPLSDTLILNAAVGLFLYGKVKSLKEGVAVARQAVERKSFKEALKATPCAIIAEIKKASPSQGKISEMENLSERASLYVQGGAAAISVLTSSRFEGSLEDLGEVAAALRHTNIPVLRKDFILEPIQIAQAAAHGADAVLLIASYLKERTEEMIEKVKEMGLEAIVEVHKEEELCFCKGGEIIGVNQRNLSDFSMHPKTHERIISKIPKQSLAVAASGISSFEEADRLFHLGYSALLIGEALSRSIDPLHSLSLMRLRCS